MQYPRGVCGIQNGSVLEIEGCSMEKQWVKTHNTGPHSPHEQRSKRLVPSKKTQARSGGGGQRMFMVSDDVVGRTHFFDNLIFPFLIA